VRDDELIDPAAVAAAVTPRTAAIMAVHLRGAVCDLPALRAIAERHGLLLVEDAAQAIGSRLGNVRTGALGDLGCFSTHPLKLLNAAGDGGFVTTNVDAVAQAIRRVRNHGLVDRNTVAEWGTVSRLDPVQAAILRYRLGRLNAVIERRRANAAFYRRALAGKPLVLPSERDGEFHTFNTYTVRLEAREALQAWLTERGVESLVHYAKPIHLQPAATSLGVREGQFPVTERLAQTILSIPIHQFLAGDDLAAIASAIAGFFDRWA
jgi:dTDP-4-amino-4,6-dideoxygalactose transaminase